MTNFKTKTSEDIENEISQILSSISASKTIERAVNNVPIKYRLQYARCLSQPAKKALAIKMKCYECVGFESVADRISGCQVRLCPVWLHRPFQDSTSSVEAE